MSYDINYQAKVLKILRGLITSSLASACSGKCYWQVAPQSAELPYILFSSADGGGKRQDYIGENSWTGLITLRVLSLDQDYSDDLLATLPGLLQNISGFNFIPGKPLVIPPEEYQDGFIFTACVLSQATFS